MTRTAKATERAKAVHLERALNEERPEPEPGATGMPARLRKRRLELGLSTQELGRLAEVDGALVRKVEVSKAKREQTIEKLAKAMGVSPGWLAFGKEE